MVRAVAQTTAQQRSMAAAAAQAAVSAEVACLGAEETAAAMAAAEAAAAAADDDDEKRVLHGPLPGRQRMLAVMTEVAERHIVAYEAVGSIGPSPWSAGPEAASMDPNKEKHSMSPKKRAEGVEDDDGLEDW